MGEIIRQLSTGDTMVFDKQSRTLYLIDPTVVNDASQITLQTAQTLAAEGHAVQFDYPALETLMEAMSAVVLLAFPPIDTAGDALPSNP